MSTFAIIPWDNRSKNDRMFDISTSLNRDHLLDPFLDFRQTFESEGHTIHTLDCFSSYDGIDYFLFFTLDWTVYKEIVRCGKSDRMVYCTAEPPSVHRWNSPSGYRVLKHIFPYILTYNSDWTDNKSVFLRNLPCFISDQRSGNCSFENKKLLTSVSGYKHSSYKGELYSERERAIGFFESNYPDEFEFYGTGWDTKDHVCYRGLAGVKSDVYHMYRFALCYENIEGLSGYVTEKIIDCLVSGIVPIYAGAIDIGDFIPEGSYINLRDYIGYEELYQYLKKINKEQYEKYLRCAERIFEPHYKEIFSGSRYARLIMEAVSKERKYKSSYVAYKLFKRMYGF